MIQQWTFDSRCPAWQGDPSAPPANEQLGALAVDPEFDRGTCTHATHLISWGSNLHSGGDWDVPRERGSHLDSGTLHGFAVDFIYVDKKPGSCHDPFGPNVAG